MTKIEEKKRKRITGLTGEIIYKEPFYFPVIHIYMQALFSFPLGLSIDFVNNKAFAYNLRGLEGLHTSLQHQSPIC